jgi:monoamine oxidase
VRSSDGYSQLVNFLRAGLTDVRVNTEVTRIAYTAGVGATVTTRQGAVLSADRVVVTVPLGVLQSGSITFAPPLPAAKASAIARMGVCTFNKVFLRFRTRFWPSGGPWFLGVSAADPFGVTISAMDATSNTLIVWFFGRRAEQLEQGSDAAAVATAMADVRACFGSSAAITQPTASFVTRWKSEPFSRGSYSFPKVCVVVTHPRRAASDV